jgi:arsenate reductase
MAEGLWKAETDSDWEVHSAGSSPVGYVHPLAIQSLSELGLDISSYRSKHLNQFLHESFDLVITVCDNAAQNCPVFSGAKQTLHWPFPDPAQVKGTHKEQLSAFRTTRDQIATRIKTHLFDCFSANDV